MYQECVGGKEVVWIPKQPMLGIKGQHNNHMIVLPYKKDPTRST